MSSSERPRRLKKGFAFGDGKGPETAAQRKPHSGQRNHRFLVPLRSVRVLTTRVRAFAHSGHGSSFTTFTVLTGLCPTEWCCTKLQGLVSKLGTEA